MTLTYNPRLAKVKVNPLAKNQGQLCTTGIDQHSAKFIYVY